MAFTYSWTTIADSATDPDSPLDTALMTAIRNNIVYVYEYVGGKSYTPAEPHTHDGINSALIATVADGGITEPKLGASAVSQGKLKTGLNTISSSVKAYGASVLAGGRYCFLPSGVLGGGSGADSLGWLAGGQINSSGNFASGFLQSSATPSDVYWTVSYGSRSVEVALLAYQFDLDDSSNIYVQYVAACPPYDLGNGDIPMFYYGLLNNTTRNIDVLWGAEDPPFANNGPTIINPLGRIRRLVPGTLVDDNGRAARIVALKRARALMRSNDPKDQAAVRAILDAPVTMEEKLRDMPLIPHPFASNLAGYTVVLLDPCGSVVEDLWLGETYGGDDAHKIIHGGKLIIDNTPCGAISPPGVMAVGCRWKNTP